MPKGKRELIQNPKPPNLQGLLDAKRAKKGDEALKEETEKAAGKLEAEHPVEKPIDKVNRLIKDNGLDEREIKELFKSGKSQKSRGQTESS